ncbi:MAG TPA: CopD family protein [Acetobacteraceae bacterium]|nr:CopD family protein [Acetobacteraceae bacterium]
MLRGTHVAGLVSLFGTLVFLTLVVPSAIAEAGVDATHLLRLRLLHLARFSAALALIIGIAWITVESAVIAGAGSVAMTLHALPIVALRTQFGQWLLVRSVLLVAILLLLRPWRAVNTIAMVLAAIALAVQPVLGHAGALGGSIGTTLIISEVLHLLAAGAWLGSLLPLFITIGTLAHNAAATACRSFTPVGLSAVLALVGTATVQITEFMGGLPGLFGTGYGQVALVKLGLFVVLLALAALNRLALTERLAGTASDAARRHMRISVAVEAVLGTLVVLTAGFLSSHTPGTHEQPVWPFAWRLSLSVFYVPELRNEVTAALVAVGAAVIIAVIGAIWRKMRWPALLLAAITLALAIPQLDLLFVAAYPTSFFTSPTEFAATAIVHGAKLFAANCVVCHGVEGRGDGPSAKSLALQPADLTAEHFWAHSDGELFWYISHGFPAPDGSLVMPGFGTVLSTEARWDLIDYLRAHNSGESMRTTGKWSHPLPMPQFDVACADGRTLDLDDLRGRVLRVIALSDDEAAAVVPPLGVDITTIKLSRKPPAGLDPATCVASEPETWTAFAILSGVADGVLAGEQILIDQNAWLRAEWRPGEPGDWMNAQALAATIRDIAAHPIAADTAGGHVHRH